MSAQPGPVLAFLTVVRAEAYSCYKFDRVFLAFGVSVLEFPVWRSGAAPGGAAPKPAWGGTGHDHQWDCREPADHRFFVDV